MGKLFPCRITAQVVAVLPLEKLAVNTKQQPQQLAAYGESVNITLLKKDANSCVIRLPSATSFQLRLT